MKNSDSMKNRVVLKNCIAEKVRGNQKRGPHKVENESSWRSEHTKA
jgi:hypothetical protein